MSEERIRTKTTEDGLEYIEDKAGHRFYLHEFNGEGCVSSYCASHCDGLVGVDDFTKGCKRCGQHLQKCDDLLSVILCGYVLDESTVKPADGRCSGGAYEDER